MAGPALRTQQSVSWTLLGEKVPRSEIVYFCQVLILFTVIVTSIYNLTAGDGKDSNLWTSLLCSSLGYLLPNPSLNRSNKNDLSRSQTDVAASPWRETSST